MYSTRQPKPASLLVDREFFFDLKPISNSNSQSQPSIMPKKGLSLIFPWAAKFLDKIYTLYGLCAPNLLLGSHFECLHCTLGDCSVTLLLAYSPCCSLTCQTFFVSINKSPCWLINLQMTSAGHASKTSSVHVLQSCF